MRASLVLLAIACPPAAGCSLIVQFHDQPVGDAGGIATDGGSLDVPTAEGAGDDAPQDTMPGSDTSSGGGDSAIVDTSAVDTFDPCLGKSGYYCGDNGLPAGFPAGDLVHCVDGGVGMVTMCSGGCLHVVDPFPDACNPCFGVANGNYCGRDLAGFPALNADILITCASGMATAQNACAHGCMSSGTMSACYP